MTTRLNTSSLAGLARGGSAAGWRAGWPSSALPVVGEASCPATTGACSSCPAAAPALQERLWQEHRRMNAVPAALLIEDDRATRG